MTDLRAPNAGAVSVLPSRLCHICWHWGDSSHGPSQSDSKPKQAEAARVLLEEIAFFFRARYQSEALLSLNEHRKMSKVFSLTGTSLVLFYYIRKRTRKASMSLIPSTLAHSIKCKRHCSISGVDLLNLPGVATLFSVLLPNSAQNKHKLFLDKEASGSHIRLPITLSRNMPFNYP